MDFEQTKEFPSPYNEANVFSKLYICWIFPFLKHGQKGNLQVTDLHDCPFSEATKEVATMYREEWQKELSSAKPSLLRATVRCFGPAFGINSIFGFFWCIFYVSQAIFIGQMLEYFALKEPGNSSDICIYTTCFCVSAFAHSVLYARCHYVNNLIGNRMRVACCSLLYRKALKLSQSSLGETTLGQIVNILTNDVNRFEQLLAHQTYVISGFLAMLAAIVVLWSLIGYAGVVGMVVLLLYVPVMASMGKLFMKLRQKTAVLTDERIRLMNEVIGGMRVIKMYGWEAPFAKLVDAVRKSELNQIRQTFIFRAFVNSLYNVATQLNLLAAIAVYVLAIGGDLTPEKVFVPLSLYILIQGSLIQFLPFAVSGLVETMVTLKRIQKFLLMEEKDVPVVERPQLSECGVWMSGVTAAWEKDIVLQNISLSVKAGELFAVVGQVGCGKSSLLLSVLGELPLLSGSCVRKGRISYASQEAWVYGGTIRENILIGSTMDEMKYQEVLEACALSADLNSFPEGDLSLVGEKGVILSGGQRARVNLARAVYSDADVYLLDDPLSAVDSSVGKHLFDKCINGFLKDKVKILVTHQVQLLKETSRILVLAEGQCKACGTYEELIKDGVDFGSLLKHEEDDESTETENFDIQNSNNVTPVDKPAQAAVTKIQEEAKSSGSVESSVYLDYFRAGIGLVGSSFVLLCCLGGQVLTIISQFWLAAWANRDQKRDTIRNCWFKLNNSSLHSPVDLRNGVSDFHLNSSPFCFEQTNNFTLNATEAGYHPESSFYLTWYSVLVGCTFLVYFLQYTLYYMACMRASRNLHNNMFQNILKTSVAFFDNNPVGRILNRFSKDVGIIDESLPDLGASLLRLTVLCGGVLVLASIVQPFLLIPTAVLLVIFTLMGNFYINSARDLKRYEGITRSPVFSHLSNSLRGLTTVRAFGVQGSFEILFDRHLDRHTAVWFLYTSAARWLAMTMDLFVLLYTIVLAVTMVFLAKDPSFTSMAGLVLARALQLCGQLQYTIRQAADVESQMTSVERVVDYSRLPPEADLESRKDKRPPKNWPYRGSLVFKGVSLRYAPHLPYILEDINFEILPKEKVGIVGRTGAGKSSLISALFRLAEPDGQIIIDGICTKDIGLHDVRKNISIIPQDPVLFNGSIRMNLDPFQEYSDDDLWQALEETHLKDRVTLDTCVSEGGSNFSVGQKQLICLARAILRRNKIIVLDEATANVDHKTDSLIQQTLRERFEHCTVLTVAHRLNTVMDSHRIMVMERGQLREFDEPLLLLENPCSLFSQMVQVTGPSMAQQLTDIARLRRKLHEESSEIVMTKNKEMTSF